VTSTVNAGCLKSTIQRYSKCYCAARVSKNVNFNKIVKGIERWIVCKLLSVNVFVKSRHTVTLEYHCNGLYETSCSMENSLNMICGTSFSLHQKVLRLLMQKTTDKRRVGIRITGFHYFVHRQEFELTRKHDYRKLDLFTSSGDGKETPALLGPLEKI
jgi:hypothetical protein